MVSHLLLFDSKSFVLTAMDWQLRTDGLKCTVEKKWQVRIGFILFFGGGRSGGVVAYIYIYIFGGLILPYVGSKD